MTRVYEGHSIFSIFENDEKFHQQIIEQLNSRKFPKEINSQGDLVENSLLRKLSLILNTPSLKNIYEKQKSVEDEKKLTKKDSKETSPGEFNTVC